jgi:hypothetical protein
MTKRFSIMGRPYGQNGLIEICQCDPNPEVLVEAASRKMIKIWSSKQKNKVVTIRKYEHVTFMENKPEERTS